MPRTALTVLQVTRTGLTPSYTAGNGSGGHSLPNNAGNEFIHVKTTTNAVVVTIQTPGTVDGLAIADRTVSIGTSSERMIGPFPPSYYNQADGAVYIDFDVVTGATIAAIRPVPA
jgi:hypothetical protein